MNKLTGSLKATFHHLYRKAGGTTVMVFAVAGTPEQLAAYKEAQGTYYREDPETKVPLFFATEGVQSLGKQLSLIQTYSGRIVVDDSNQVFEEQRQLKTFMLQEEAKIRVQRRFGIAGGVSSSPAAVAYDPAQEMPENIVVGAAQQPS